MALWQFELDLIPASAAKSNGTDAIRMSREQLDSIRIDLPDDDERKLYDWLESLLPEKESWSKDLRIWGDEKTDDIQVFLDGNRVELVQFRLDVSDLSLELIRGICNVAQNLNCLLADRRGAILRPTAETVVRAVMQSPATRFVKDPEAYLKAAIMIDVGEN